MEGREWGTLNSNLAACLVDFASRKLANPNESRFEKLDAFKRVCGFEWSRRTIAKASPRKISALVQRAVRNEATKELAKKLRTTLRKIWFSTPPIVAEDPHEWWALLSSTGISSLANDQIWLALFADLESMLIFSPSDLGAMQLDQLHLSTTDVAKGRLLNQLWRTVKAGQSKTPGMSRFLPSLFVSTGANAFELADCLAADSTVTSKLLKG